jgi:CBS domain-containing protein
MNADPVVTAPATQLGDAIQTMLEARTDSLPVVSNGRLVGIVTTHDVLTVLGKMLTTDENNCPKEEIGDPSKSKSEAA